VIWSYDSSSFKGLDVSQDCDAFSRIGREVPLRFLSLEGNRIEKVPRALTDFTCLQELRLSANDLQSLDAGSCCGLTALTVLDLSSNRLKALPEDLALLTSLRSLSLDNNQLKALPCMQDWTSLLRLSASNNELNCLPATFSSLVSLQTMVVNNNLIDVLPANLSRLTSLRSFDISYNCLRHLGLPDNGLHQLSSLTSLEAKMNEIAELSVPGLAGTCMFEGLEVLNLKGNKLLSLPQEVLHLHRLKELDLSYNLICEAKDFLSLGGMQLDKVLLQGNPLFKDNAELRAFEDDHQGLVSFIRSQVEMHMERRSLTDLPALVLKSRELRHLFLSHNLLLKLPETMTSLTSLQTLHVDNNRLILLERWISELQSLTDVNLSVNNLQTLPSTFSSLPRLTLLNVSNNHIFSLPRFHESVKVITGR